MDETAQIIVSMFLGIALVIGGLCYGSYKESELIVEMVKSGADPLKASCAIKGSTELNKQICHTL